MGGCRCTYRNCTVRTDGTTHLFHYPVFDKYRCHQWLTNAQRLDFLNLKVSQLKNRVVCQYHFKDEMFMNFKKDKLKCSAVPTEDGPFCEGSNNTMEPCAVLYPIDVEQIENEFINGNSDKMAKFSVKYGDFLTNCELMELNSAKQESENKTIQSPKVRRKLSQPPVIKIHFDNEMELVDKQYYTESNQNYAKETAETDKNAPDCIQLVSTTPNQITITYEPTIKNKLDNCQRQPKVKILSEEPFNQPLTEAPTLIPIPKNYVLHVPDKKNKVLKVENNNNSYNYNLAPAENSVQSNLYLQNISEVVYHNENNRVPTNEPDAANSFNTHEPMHSNVVTLSTSKSKNISDERVAAIQEKRKFNRKLRDIITDSLNLLEDPVEQKRTKTQDTVRYNPEVEVMQQQLIKDLEAQMKTMEDKLLKKIDSNRSIMLEMKKQISDMKKDKEKQSSCIQQVSPELHKKNLFHEISKYLTTEAKSLIYEELFLNEHVLPIKTPPPEQARRASKRRKR